MATWRVPKRVMKPFEYLRVVHKENFVEIRVAIKIDKISLNKNMRVDRKCFAERYFDACAIIAEKLEYRVVPKYWEECRPNWSDVLKKLKIVEVSKLESPELFTGRVSDVEYRYVTTEEEVEC